MAVENRFLGNRLRAARRNFVPLHKYTYLEYRHHFGISPIGIPLISASRLFGGRAPVEITRAISLRIERVEAKGP